MSAPAATSPRGNAAVAPVSGEVPAAGPVPRSSSHAIDENTPMRTLVLEVLRRSLPLGLAAVAQMSIGVVLVAMVGKMVGDTELGAATLASGLLNATAFSFSAGFCGALETVLSHSFGRDPNSKLYGVYGQRMALMLLMIAALVGPIMTFSDSLLIAIGQNAEVAHHTGRFCRVALFSVYFVMLLEMMRRYFACQHLNTQLSVNLLAGAASFPFVLYASIKLFGFVGAAFAWALLMFCMPTSLLVYLYVTGKYKRTWGGWEPTALMNWGPLLKLAMPSMAMMLSEWMSLEINLIIAGYAPTSELAAFSIVYQCSGIFWSMASGAFVEAAVLVGNALGQGKPMFARRCALMCLGLSACYALVNITLLFLLRNWIPTLFTDNVAVHELFRKMLKFFVVYHFFDCVQSCMMGVLRGCGLQSLGALSITLVYSVVGVPLGAIVFFKTSMGVEALWMGPCIGVSVAGFPLYCYLFRYYIKWETLEQRQEEVPSLNTSMDERSMRAYTGTPPPSDPGSEREMGTSGSDVDGPAGHGRRGGRFGTPNLSPTSEPGRFTPNSIGPSAASGAHDNASFTSMNTFYIPQRSILMVPPFLATSPNPSDAPLPPALARSPMEDSRSHAGASLSSPTLAARPKESANASLHGVQRAVVLRRGSKARSRSHSAPPSSSNSSGCAPGSPPLASSVSSQVTQPREGLRTNLPTSSSSSATSSERSRDGTYRT